MTAAGSGCSRSSSSASRPGCEAGPPSRDRRWLVPPEARVTRLLQDVAQRVRWQWAARVASASALAALGPFILTRRALPSLVVGALTALVYWWLTRRSRRNPAVLLEARVPECRNILITADALLTRRLRAKPEVFAVVVEDAALRADLIAPGV